MSDVAEAAASEYAAQIAELERELRETRETSLRTFDGYKAAMDRALLAEARVAELRQAISEVLSLKDAIESHAYMFGIEGGAGWISAEYRVEMNRVDAMWARLRALSGEEATNG